MSSPHYVCPYCRQRITFVETYQRWYCATCHRYLGALPRKSKIALAAGIAILIILAYVLPLALIYVWFMGLGVGGYLPYRPAEPLVSTKTPLVQERQDTGGIPASSPIYSDETKEQELGITTSCHQFTVDGSVKRVIITVSADSDIDLYVYDPTDTRVDYSVRPEGNESVELDENELQEGGLGVWSAWVHHWSHVYRPGNTANYTIRFEFYYET
jgi:hypothetical protein